MILLPYEHLARCCEIACGKRVEIETTRHFLAMCVSTIPIRCPAFAMIHARWLMP